MYPSVPLLCSAWLWWGIWVRFHCHLKTDTQLSDQTSICQYTECKHSMHSPEHISAKTSSASLASTSQRLFLEFLFFFVSEMKLAKAGTDPSSIHPWINSLKRGSSSIVEHKTYMEEVLKPVTVLPLNSSQQNMNTLHVFLWNHTPSCILSMSPS